MVNQWRRVIFLYTNLEVAPDTELGRKRNEKVFEHWGVSFNSYSNVDVDFMQKRDDQDS